MAVKWTLFRAILLLMLVASLVPTLMVGWVSVSDTREFLIRDAQELSQERVKHLQLKVHALLDEPARAALSLAKIPGFFQLPLPEQRSYVAAILNQRREIAAITLFSADGSRIPGLQAFAIRDIPPTEVAAHDARSAALVQGLRALKYSEVYLSPSRREPVLTLGFPVGREPVQAFVTTDVFLGDLATLMAAEKIGSTGFAYVVDVHGKLVASSPALGGLTTGDFVSSRPVVAHFLATVSASPTDDLFRVGNFGTGTQQVVGAYAYLPDVGWAIVSEQPVQGAYAQVRTMERAIGLSLAGAMVVAVTLAAFFSRSLTRPLKGFIAGALELAQGKLGVQVNVKAKNEIGELAKTFNYMSLQLQAYDAENKRLYESLEKGYLETIVALANSVDSKDAYTRGHSQRVGDFAVEIGRELGLNARELKLLHYGGILHDVGKIGIIDSILCKQTRLTDEEMAVMREHPAIGDTIIAPVTFLATVRPAVRSHHERWDGQGYPDKLKGEAIPLVARIVNCADTLDAITSTRPYQKAMPLEKAVEILNRLRGTQIDPAVLDALLGVIQKRGILLEGQKEVAKLAS